jgi:hypothetical protein
MNNASGSTFGGLRDELAGNSMIVQMYVPGWGTGTGKSEIMDVEFEHAGKVKKY